MSHLSASLTRIDSKLDDLVQRVREFEVHPCEVVHDDNLETGERVYSIRNVKALTSDLTLDITEITMLMRMILDHAMWVLAVVNNGNQRPLNVTRDREIYFPISKIGKNLNETKTLDRFGLSPSAKRWVQSFQPNGRTDPREMPLVMLDAIVNIAKHRFHHLIWVVATQVTHMSGNIPKSECRELRVEEGAVIGVLIPSKTPTWGFADVDPETYEIGSGNVEKATQLFNSFGTPSYGGAWTQADWDTYWSGCETQISLTQQILFGDTSELVAGLSVVDTLEAIRTELHQKIFTATDPFANFRVKGE